MPPARFPLEKFLLTCSRFACILSQVTFLPLSGAVGGPLWRRIEVVITRTTRNRLIGDEPVRGFESHRLRHKNSHTKRCGYFYGCRGKCKCAGQMKCPCAAPHSPGVYTVLMFQTGNRRSETCGGFSFCRVLLVLIPARYSLGLAMAAIEVRHAILDECSGPAAPPSPSRHAELPFPHGSGQKYNKVKTTHGS